MWKSIRDSINQFVRIAENATCVSFLSFGFACALVVWSGSSDVTLMWPVLFLAAILANVGWWHAPNLSKQSRLACIFLTFIFLVLEGTFVTHHGKADPAQLIDIQKTQVVHFTQMDGYQFAPYEQHTAYTRFQHDFPKDQNYTFAVAYEKRVYGNNYPVMFTCNVHADRNSATKFLSIYMPPNVKNPSLMDDVLDDVTKNLQHYLNPPASAGPLPLGDSGLLDFSGELYFYLESRVPASTTSGFRVIARHRGFNLKFRGPEGPDY